MSAILPARNKVSYRKIKDLLGVRDVRLANYEEVLKHSGYPAGGVPPFNRIRRVNLDPHVLNNDLSIIRGGYIINKLVEVRTEDLVSILKPRIANIRG